MKLRWLLRIFAIALLTLCLSVWIWSYFRSLSIGYCPSLGKSYWVDTHMGGAFLSSSGGIWSSPGWRFQHIHHAFPLSEVSELLDFKSFLGFGYFHVADTVWGVAIPFWFPSLLSAALLWFVWRQTRPKTAGRGFPVEVTQASQ